MKLTSHELAPIIAYSRNFHRNLPETTGNVVASPLGAWLLLTALAVSVDYEAHPGLEQVLETKLCCSVDEAFTLFEEITKNPDVHYSAQVWGSGENMKHFPETQKWWERNRLLPTNGTTNLPTQAELDRWAEESTDGLVKEFPVGVKPDTVLIAANAVYSKLAWLHPFSVIEDTGMQEAWAVQKFLSSQNHSVLFREIRGVTYATVYVGAKTGEQVLLILPLEDVETQVLTDAMHSVLVPTEGQILSYTDVNLIPGVVEFHKVRATAGPVFDLKVPAWSAETKHDLMADESLGFGSLTDMFESGSAPDEELVVEAAQSAVAKFTAEGFEAAAVTAFSLTRASAMFTSDIQDLVVLKFTKTFGYMCLVGNIPVFSGVIREASDNVE